ncbi:hypothetical protein D3C75_728570 [compost metagenome]
MRRGLQAFRVQVHGPLVALQQVIEQAGGRVALAVQFVEVDPGGGLADAHAHQWAAHHGGHHFLLEELEDLRHILLLLRFQPLAGRDGQQDQSLGQRHAPFQAELFGPGVHCVDAAAGETAYAIVDAVVQVLTRVLQQCGGCFAVEPADLDAAGQLGGFLDDRID